MKSCQISAGKVPPSTGPSSKSLVIGMSLLGKPTHTATVYFEFQPMNHASP